MLFYKTILFFLLVIFSFSIKPLFAVPLADSSRYNPVLVQSIEPQDDVPVGTVIPWPTNKPLPGQNKGSQKWLVCDGSPVPAGTRFARLRSLIGNILPKYNNTFRDSQGGMFLRGNMQASNTYNQQFIDQTEEHVHEQPLHSHPFDLKLLNDLVKGNTNGQLYKDLKRGEVGHGPNSEWQENAGKIGFNPYSELNSIYKTHVELEGIRINPDGSVTYIDGSNKDTYQPRAIPEFHGMSAFFGFEGSKRPDGEDHVITSDAQVNLTHVGQWHCLDWGTCTDSEGESYRCCKRNAYCNSASATTSTQYRWRTLQNDIGLRTLTSMTHDGSTPGDSDLRGWYAGMNAWGIALATDVMKESYLKNTALINDNIVGEIKKEGGDESYPGEDNRGIKDGMETAPAHIMVRYIIKALP